MLGLLRSRLPAIGKWPRLLLAGACLLLALNGAVGASHQRSRPPRTIPVVVAQHGLPAGHVLLRGDLAVAHWPLGVAPVGARGDPAGLVGRRVAGPVAAREAITSLRLVGADLTADLDPGVVAAAVPLGDPHAADLVRAGDRVDLLTGAGPPEAVDVGPASSSDVRTIASRALVLSVLPPTDSASAELVVAVDRATAVRITRNGARQAFTVIVDPP
ncbi:MAG TPA: SAF domain-containing protein [Jatrophihabitans sp.]|nr:SAF domain-containing protein [Jatrophihabitans sp.]